MMDRQTKIVYETLKDRARARKTISYTELSKLIGLRPNDRSFHRMLDAINRDEHQSGRPY